MLHDNASRRPSCPGVSTQPGTGAGRHGSWGRRERYDGSWECWARRNWWSREDPIGTTMPSRLALPTTITSLPALPTTTPSRQPARCLTATKSSSTTLTCRLRDGCGTCNSIPLFLVPWLGLVPSLRLAGESLCYPLSFALFSHLHWLQVTNSNAFESR
ncbi:hypothetical protein BGZ61DRAFT_454626 [Ilyonectria robusta]|uniref:uncharacterized protein n=1 Tax=Ilyonectria robusta TaxID=1079257 RepID=UPI001E8E7E81|nr:uncharacterized protein BGZ61DRAFT_454626 [Ilyonectria robusta]KAH8686549.1 hypothetical protein BGZ61DRAFT_454626 [Ilyonectria robusta]